MFLSECGPTKTAEIDAANAVRKFLLLVRNSYNFLESRQCPDRPMMLESQRGEYLETMGIEVWYSKSMLQSTAGSDSDTAQIGASSAFSPFNIGMLQYPGCLMLFDLDDAVESLAPEYQRLLDDLALAMGVAATQSQLFRQDSSSEGDPSVEIQRRAGQLIGDHNSCVLVMGDIARRLLFGDQMAVMMTTSFLGRRAITAMGLDVLLNDPICKRSLWQKMQEPGPGTDR
jgi:hypothetical protein